MKKIIIFAVCIFVSITLSVAIAQKKEGRNRSFSKKEFFEKRRAFLQKEMGLTDEEAAAFFPLTEEFMQKRFEESKSFREAHKKIKRNPNVTDADYEKILDLYIDLKIKNAELEKEYYKRYKQVLPAKKLFEYQRSERKFGNRFM